MPQPFGPICDVCLDDEGNIRDAYLAKQHLGVIGVGSHTTNFLHSFKFRDVPHETASRPFGMWEVVKEVKVFLDKAYPTLQLRDHEIVDVIQTKQVVFQGDIIDISAVVNVAIENLVNLIVSEASIIWKECRDKMVKIYLVGGGSIPCGSGLQRKYKQAVLVDQPVFAIVRGYRKYAQLL